MDDRIYRLTDIMDGYFKQSAFHLNVNVLDRNMLVDAMNNPSKYPNLTIRVSGYAVRFNQLSKAHQKRLLLRIFHEKCKTYFLKWDSKCCPTFLLIIKIAKWAYKTYLDFVEKEYITSPGII